MLREPPGKRRRRGSSRGDGKCHRKYTAFRRSFGAPEGKGEKVGQEPTALRREAGGTKNPFRCKTK